VVRWLFRLMFVPAAVFAELPGRPLVLSLIAVTLG
jgi:hypothetical protein